RITGVNFLAVNTIERYMDYANNHLAMFRPDNYQIKLKNIVSISLDTITRTLDSSTYISADYMRYLHRKYTKKPKLSLFDSMDAHCEGRTRLLSMRLSGDSILYVYYINRRQHCSYLNDIPTARYLDIWRRDSDTTKWYLLHKDLRIDNYAECKKKDLKIIKKNMLSFSLMGLEAQWAVYSGYLIIPKNITDKVDLDADLSLTHSRENYIGEQN